MVKQFFPPGLSLDQSFSCSSSVPKESGHGPARRNLLTQSLVRKTKIQRDEDQNSGDVVGNGSVGGMKMRSLELRCKRESSPSSSPSALIRSTLVQSPRPSLRESTTFERTHSLTTTTQWTRYVLHPAAFARVMNIHVHCNFLVQLGRPDGGDIRGSSWPWSRLRRSPRISKVQYRRVGHPTRTITDIIRVAVKTQCQSQVL